mgnify:FL=1|tara:strand:+ start:177 stop:1901 length:1725 start_codon:yes stop_codon:yes gene_type:complete
MAIDSATFAKKAQEGTLTVSEAVSYALTHGRIDSDSARSRIKALRSGFKNMGLDYDMLYKDLKLPENLGLFNRELSPDKSNRFTNLQALESALQPAMTKFNLRTITEPFEDGLEQLTYPLLAGDTGYAKQIGLGGTQRTGLAQERPMEGVLSKQDLDRIYASNLSKIADDYGQPVADLMLYHKSTATRPTQLINLKKSDIRITDTAVNIKGKKPNPKNKKDKKFRPELTFDINTPEAKAIVNSYNTSTTDLVFNVTEQELDTAFNKYISPELEKFSDVLPLADTKIEDAEGNVTIGQKPVTTKSAIRAIVPKYLIDEFNVPADIVQGVMGHKDTSILATNYTGSRPTKDIPLILSNPSEFSITGFGGSGMAGFNIYSAMTPEQRAALGDKEFKRLMAAANVEEAERLAALAKIDPAAIKKGIDIQTQIDIYKTKKEAEVNLAREQARTEVKQKAKAAEGMSFFDSVISRYGPSKKTLKSIAALPLVGAPIAGVFEAREARSGGADMPEALLAGAGEALLPITPSDIETGKAAAGYVGSQMQELMERPSEANPQGSSLTDQMRSMLGQGGGFNFN